VQKSTDRIATRRRIRFRIRKKVTGTAAKPRLAVFRSDKHIYAQAIDDGTGRTVAHASTLDTDLKGTVKNGGNVEAARRLGMSGIQFQSPEQLREDLQALGVGPLATP
jgi:large subunit ribosomal protein L18